MPAFHEVLKADANSHHPLMRHVQPRIEVRDCPNCHVRLFIFRMPGPCQGMTIDASSYPTSSSFFLSVIHSLSSPHFSPNHFDILTSRSNAST